MIDDIINICLVTVFKTELSRRPWCRFMVLFSAWIRSASLYLLFHQMDSCSRTCALFHWISCKVLLACTFMPLLFWCVLTARLCSLSQTSNFLHVSPIFVLPQLQSTLNSGTAEPVEEYFPVIISVLTRAYSEWWREDSRICFKRGRDSHHYQRSGKRVRAVLVKVKQYTIMIVAKHRSQAQLPSWLIPNANLMDTL